MEIKNENIKKIKGWGSDADPAKRPAYPKERTPPRYINAHWENPEQQLQKVRIFHSTERPGITPVFGTSTPPSGLSGFIREMAYKYSENDVRRWYMLVAADRVNVVEGLFEDFSKGRLPNILAEMGIGAELKYNKKGLVKKTLVVGGLISLAVLYLQNRSQKRILPHTELGY
jgi:hypothetical protein